MTSLGAGYAPLMTGIPHVRRSPFEGVPLLSSGPTALLGMALTPQLVGAMGAVGLTPLGLGHDQNPYDNLLNQRFTQMQMEAVRAASVADYSSYMSTFRGIAAMTGTPWGSGQRQAAGTLAGAMTSFSPMLVDALPDVMDQLGGVRGSAAVLARRMIDAGRYRHDPVTGRLGMTGESTGQISRDLYQQLYGTGADVRNMQGITAGQLGGMFEELSNRGMIGATSPLARNQQLTSTMHQMLQIGGGAAGGGLGALGGMAMGGSTAQIEQLMSGPEMSGQARALDTARIRRSLQNYIGVISTMRDIFGDVGRPNAPMSELVNALEAFSMRGLAQFSPQRLSQMARQTHGLAQLTGVITDAALMMQQQAGVRAQQLGIEPVFAIQATQGALAFGGAYRASGAAANPFWGAYNADQLTQLDMNLRTQASSSPMANRLNTLMRAQSIGAFQTGTTAAAMANAIASGAAANGTFFDPVSGQRRSLNMHNEEFVSTLVSGGSGLGANDVRSMLTQSGVNREFGAQFNTQDIVRQSQGREEVMPFIQQHITATLTDRLQSQFGGTPGEARSRAMAAAQRIAGRVTDRAFALSAEDFNPARRSQNIGRIIEEELRNDTSNPLSSMTPDARRQWSTQTAALASGNVDTAIASSPLQAWGNWGNTHAALNPQTSREAARRVLRVQLDASFREALAPLRPGTVLRDAVDALQNLQAGDPNPVGTVLGRMAGGVSTDALREAIRAPMTGLRAETERLDRLKREVETLEPGSRAQQDMLAEISTRTTQVNQHVRLMDEIGERFGLGGTMLSGVEIDRALVSRANMFRSTQDLAGIRGGFDALPTDAQQQSARAAVSGRALTRGESEAVWRANRTEQINALREPNNPFVQAAMTRQGLTRAAAIASETDRLRSMQPTDAMLAAFGETFSQNLREPAGSPNATQSFELIALARYHRQALPTAATADDIARVRREHPSLTESQASDVANARLQAHRLGVTDQAIEQTITNNPRFANRPELYGEAVRETIRQQEEAMMVGTPEEIQARQAARNGRFNEFWASNSGRDYRQDIDRSMQATDTIAQGLITDPMIARFGTRAIDMNREMETGQRRLRALATMHAGGDMSRLLSGDMPMNLATAEGRQQYREVTAEIRGIQQRQQTIIVEQRDAQGRDGRQWRVDNVEEAKRMLNITGPPTAAQNASITALARRIEIAKRLPSDSATMQTLQAYKDRQPGVALTPDLAMRMEALRSTTRATDLDEVGGAYDTLLQLQELGRARQRETNQTPDQVLAEFVRSHMPGTDLSRFRGALTSTQAREQMQTATWSRDLMTGAAARGSRNLRELTTEYAAITDRSRGPINEAAAEADFRNRYQLTDAGAWSQFKQAAEFQQHFRLTSLGAGGTVAGDDMDPLINGMLNFNQRPSGAASGTGGSMNITGTITIPGLGQGQFQPDTRGTVTTP